MQTIQAEATYKHNNSLTGRRTKYMLSSGKHTYKFNDILMLLQKQFLGVPSDWIFVERVDVAQHLLLQ